MSKLLFSVSLIALFAAAVSAHPGDELRAPADDTQSGPAQATGSGTHVYRTVPGWANIPDSLHIGPTHGGVVVDKQGIIYVSTDSTNGFYVFSADGTLLRTMAPEFSGVHGLILREEDGREVIYGAHVKGSQVVKLTLDGRPLLTIPYPKEANLYPDGKGYRPTAVAVGPKGEIFVADGYGQSVIHKFDSTGAYLKTFGVKGEADGEFKTCHGIVLDTRYDRPLLLVCDRENRRLQHFDLDGNFVSVLTTGLRRPCAVSILGDHVAVAELEGRVTILDKSNKIVAHLGDNPDQSQWAKFDVAPEAWQPGIFTAPHGISYDAAGNLYVQDWNRTGRVTKLARVTR